MKKLSVLKTLFVVILSVASTTVVVNAVDCDGHETTCQGWQCSNASQQSLNGWENRGILFSKCTRTATAKEYGIGNLAGSQPNRLEDQSAKCGTLKIGGACSELFDAPTEDDEGNPIGLPTDCGGTKPNSTCTPPAPTN